MLIPKSQELAVLKHVAQSYDGFPNTFLKWQNI